jgi:hypothetical protein
MGQPWGPQEQQLIAQLGQAVSRLVAPGWPRFWAECRAAGRHVEVDVFVTGPDGVSHWVNPSEEVMWIFGSLRTAMYRQGRGTWLSAIFVVEPSVPYRFDVNLDVEPRWRQPPPAVGFQDELTFFPREGQWIPGWLRQRAGLPPLPAPGGPVRYVPGGPADQPPGQPAGHDQPQPAPAAPGGPPGQAPEQPPAPASADALRGQEPAEPIGSPAPEAARPAPVASERTAEPPRPSRDGGAMRTPRVHDGLDESGRPVIEREPLAPDERDRVLAYLSAAPVVLAARSYDADLFAPDRPAAVPMNFRTDGTWVWPGAVGYYLREHGIAPDPDLLAHIRDRGFAVPDVDDETRDLAASQIMQGGG